jgi:hypothetical protein
MNFRGVVVTQFAAGLKRSCVTNPWLTGYNLATSTFEFFVTQSSRIRRRFVTTLLHASAAGQIAGAANQTKFLFHEDNCESKHPNQTRVHLD